MPAAAAFVQLSASGFRPYEGGDLPCGISVIVEGVPGTWGMSMVTIPWRTSYADFTALIRSAVVACVHDQAGVTIAPDDEVRIYGGPMPTLADLGG